jgi:hypothetical protein
MIAKETFFSSKRSKIKQNLSANQHGKVIIKFFWWPLIISLGFSVIITIILNIIF